MIARPCCLRLTNTHTPCLATVALPLCPPLLSTMSSPRNLHNGDSDGEADETQSIVSYSTTSTRSDLPGAGRTLGHAYSYLGHMLEEFLKALAVKRGVGPKNVANRVYELLGSELADALHSPETIGQLSPMTEKKAKKLLKALLGYAWCVAFIILQYCLAKISQAPAFHRTRY